MSSTTMRSWRRYRSVPIVYRIGVAFVLGSVFGLVVQPANGAPAARGSVREPVEHADSPDRRVHAADGGIVGSRRATSARSVDRWSCCTHSPRPQRSVSDCWSRTSSIRGQPRTGRCGSADRRGARYRRGDLGNRSSEPDRSDGVRGHPPNHLLRHRVSDSRSRSSNSRPTQRTSGTASSRSTTWLRRAQRRCSRSSGE